MLMFRSFTGSERTRSISKPRESQAIGLEHQVVFYCRSQHRHYPGWKLKTARNGCPKQVSPVYPVI